MADTTDVLAIPFPEGGDSFAASAVQSLAERVDEVPGIESLTSAEIAALGAALKPAGRVVYNSTTGKLQRSNGTSFVDAALEPANNLSDLASASTARTNLGLGTAATTAATAYATAAQGTLADNALPASSFVWQDWTPSATATGNPTFSAATGRYLQIGDFVTFNAYLRFSAVGSGAYTFTLPAPAAATSEGLFVGVAQLAGSVTSAGQVNITASGTGAQILMDAGGFLASNNPTRGSTDKLWFSGTYEAA